jgi:hypothetical protein
MNSKDLGFLGLGFLVGYVVFKTDLLKNFSIKKTIATATETATKVVDTVTASTADVVAPEKKAKCEQAWNEKAQLIRPTSNEALEEMKNQFMTDCLLSK